MLKESDVTKIKVIYLSSFFQPGVTVINVSNFLNVIE